MLEDPHNGQHANDDEDQQADFTNHLRSSGSVVNCGLSLFGRKGYSSIILNNYAYVN